MFGFRSSVPSRAHRSLVAAENALADQSTRHPDGWGIGWFVDDEAYVVKSASAAHACDRFQRASVRLTSHTFVVHVRRATVGTVDHDNAHPFRCGRWLLAHNGTVFAFGDVLKPWLEARTSPALRALILGDTDSEHLFFYLLSALERAGLDRTGRAPSSPSLVAHTVRHALFALDDEARARSLPRPILNVLLTDGRILLAHRAGMPLLVSTQKRFCSDFHHCPAPVKRCIELARPEGFPVNHLLVASEVINAHENLWEEVEDGATLVLDEGFHLAITTPPAGWVPPSPPDPRPAATPAPS